MKRVSIPLMVMFFALSFTGIANAYDHSNLPYYGTSISLMKFPGQPVQITVVGGHIDSSNDVDCFRLKIPEKGVLVVKVEGEAYTHGRLYRFKAPYSLEIVEEHMDCYGYEYWGCGPHIGAHVEGGEYAISVVAAPASEGRAWARDYTLAVWFLPDSTDDHADSWSGAKYIPFSYWGWSQNDPGYVPVYSIFGITGPNDHDCFKFMPYFSGYGNPMVTEGSVNTRVWLYTGSKWILFKPEYYRYTYFKAYHTYYIWVEPSSADDAGDYRLYVDTDWVDDFPDHFTYIPPN